MMIIFKVDECSSLWNEASNLASMHCESAWHQPSLGIDWKTWCWTVASLQHLIQRHAWAMLPPGLWPLICRIELGGKGGTALDGPACWIRAAGGPFVSSKGLFPSRECSASVCTRDSPSLTHTSSPGPLWAGIWILLTPGVFQATSPDYITLIKSRCYRMFDRRGQMAFEKKSIAVFMTRV